jgi:hypothetical protein
MIVETRNRFRSNIIALSLILSVTAQHQRLDGQKQRLDPQQQCMHQPHAVDDVQNDALVVLVSCACR